MENFDFKKYLAEGKLLKEEQVNEASDTEQAIGIIFTPVEDEDGMIEYEWDETALKNLIAGMKYEDPGKVTNEMMTKFNPYDTLEILRDTIDDSDLDITDITLGMLKQFIEAEFPDFLD